MNQHYTYFIILAAAFIGPFALSFDKKVAFYKKWKYLFRAILFPALFYIVWDIFFTAKGIWSFNEDYITGFKIYNLPVEEVLFFFVVPYCCVFIYECMRCYFPQLKNKKKELSPGGNLKGQTFLFTGTLPTLKRSEAEAMAEENGGQILTGVSSKLNYLIVGEDAGSKLDKAKKINTVKIISEAEFLQVIGKK